MGVGVISDRAPGRRRGRRRAALGFRLLLPVLPFALVAVAWIIGSRHPPSGAWQYAVPNLGSTVHSLRTDLFTGPTIWGSVLITVKEAALGLLLAAAAGIAAGVAIGLVEFLEAMFYPTIVVVQSLPFIALAPLLVIIFGAGVWPKAVLAATLAFFPILVNVIVGMKRVRGDEIDLLRSMGASGGQVFLKLRLPRALPSMFAGLQIAALFVILGSVAGEIVNGSGGGASGGGLGVQLTIREQNVDVPGAYSIIIVLALLSLAVTLGLRAMDRYLTRWTD